MDDGGVFIVVLVVGLIIGILIGHIATSQDFQAEAIQRGYALFCPQDGEFAWKDECDG